MISEMRLQEIWSQVRSGNPLRADDGQVLVHEIHRLRFICDYLYNALGSNAKEVHLEAMDDWTEMITNGDQI